MASEKPSRIKRAWNAFRNRDPTPMDQDYSTSYTYTYRPDRIMLSRGHERSIINSIVNRIALDVAAIDIKHVQLDENGRYKEDIKSGLSNCFTLSTNIDQNSRAYLQDVTMSMLGEGVIVEVPIDVDIDDNTGKFDILTMRTGKIVKWFPDKVTVNVYNDQTGKRQDITVPKRSVSIIENPLYSIMNEPNSTLQRLIRKLSLMDVTDERMSSGKLDLVVQLPYAVKGELRQKQAEERNKKIEDQLVHSPYGIAYIDGTEKVIQLNRPVENNLMKQVEYLTSTLQSQLGITQSILDGTADEQTMLNYNTRTIEPIVEAIVKERNRKFLSDEARERGESIIYLRNPFKLVPVNSIAEISDKFTRNEIMSSNEFRQIVGLKPSDDPKADQLINSNLNHPEDQIAGAGNKEESEPANETKEEGENQNG